MTTVIKDIGKGRLLLKLGDLTKEEVDAIVNAANSSILGGGGVDGDIHAAAGPTLLQECQALRQKQRDNGEREGCPTGQAVITGAGKLKAKFVIHAVGPQSSQPNKAELLRQTYYNSLQLAESHQVYSLAFPSISTGIYAYPVQEAAEIAMQTVVEFLQTSKYVKEVRFVFHPSYNPNDLKLYKMALEKL